jgi:hypothetical protein
MSFEEEGQSRISEKEMGLVRCVYAILEKWHTRYNLDENVLEQREVIGNVDDGTDEELLKQVGNVIHTVLGEFNAVGHD